MNGSIWGWVITKKDEMARSMTVAFLQTGLYADMKLPEYLDQLARLHKRVEPSKFFLEALLVKLRDIYVRFNIEADEHERFRKLVLEISADAKGLKGPARDEYIKKYAKDLDRREVLARLRDEKA